MISTSGSNVNHAVISAEPLYTHTQNLGKIRKSMAELLQLNHFQSVAILFDLTESRL